MTGGIVTTTETIEAVFERGVFKPARPVALSEGQKVRLSIEPIGDGARDGADEMQRWHDVFAGLSQDDLVELERIITDRSRFVPDRNGGPEQDVEAVAAGDRRSFRDHRTA